MEENTLEVSLDNFIHNIQEIHKWNPDKNIIPVIKAKGYGTGITEYKELNKVLKDNCINIVAVAQTKEANDLRKNGVETDILLLNEILPEEISDSVKYDFTVGVSQLNTVELLNNFAESMNKKCKIHIKVDTGMGRVGIKPKDIKEFCKEIVNYKNIEIDGAYTHLSCADSNKEDDEIYTKKQLDDFANCISIMNSLGIFPKYTHACASSGIIKYKDNRFNSIRPGIILYGYMPSDDIKNISELDLKPVTVFKSKIVFIKEIEDEIYIGYSRTYKANSKAKIATICLGYADGLKRALSNNGYVLIKGKKAPIVGNVCMDNFMADITNIENVKLGDEVIIWDNEQITLDDIASKCNTINYEIICGVSERVERKII